MASLQHTNNHNNNNGPDSSNSCMDGVVQTTTISHSNPTMERNAQKVAGSGVSSMSNANDDAFDCRKAPKKAASYNEGRQDASHHHLSASQPLSGPPHPVNVTRFHPKATDAAASHSYSPQTLPLWRFCSMAGKGLGSKRVEDVKMNRIDKLRAGRKRRAGRRPFVFKSSPLAEGQGAGRLTQFHANTYPIPSSSSSSTTTPSSSSSSSLMKSSPFLSRESPEGLALHHATLYNGRNTVRISRFSGPINNPTSHLWRAETPMQKPVQSSSLLLDRNVSNAYSSRSYSAQPQISRLCGSNLSSRPSKPLSSKSDYQSWEISLPKCPFPKMGVLAV
ncbi:hypothetical protein VP01_814g2 [Puccinia sorghi]|uniref:Uncharacterized protein n=1 Tax=Puccinia sorghi TaxID=27349 RepID=A0A0L6UC96_9BASI|nr:hypothetical protein VP01_814g2 [Puccinia sorghi]